EIRRASGSFSRRLRKRRTRSSATAGSLLLEKDIPIRIFSTAMYGQPLIRPSADQNCPKDAYCPVRSSLLLKSSTSTLQTTFAASSVTSILHLVKAAASDLP